MLEKLSNFIGSRQLNMSYLHTTSTIDNVNSIFSNGFYYQVFKNTTDFVGRNDLTQLLLKKAMFGNYVIIIEIPKTLTDYYAVSTRGYDERGNQISILPSKYVKGYYIKTTEEIITNPSYLTF